MGFKEDLLVFTKMLEKLEFKFTFKGKANTGLSPLLIQLSLPLSQYGLLLQIINYNWKQITILLAQLLKLQETRKENIVEVFRPNTRLEVEVAMPQTFNGDLEKIRDFVMVYKLYLKIKMKKVSVKEKIQ